MLSITSCENFVEIGVPNHKITQNAVFADDGTAISAVKGIYNELYNAYYSGGSLHSITVLCDISSDILTPISSSSPYYSTYQPFYQNEISVMDTSDSSANLNIWSSAYNIIYMTNSVLEGLQMTENISENIQKRLRGEVLFIRAFTYFYLTNLYGDVPLVLSTDYRANTLASRNSATDVWKQIAKDLDESLKLLDRDVEYLNGERTEINYYGVLALRARVYLYQENWVKAEELSTQVINQRGLYEILENLDEVFLANSKEAIWQISPEGSNGGVSYTNEGAVFIIIHNLSFISPLKLINSFSASMQPEDKRLNSWMKFDEGINGYYPFKYKIRNSTNNYTEYSMVLRLAEQYLIRAEARAMQGKFSEAIADVDKLRIRAGVAPVSNTNNNIGKEVLLELIMHERKKELFSEWGHRWFDLKRTEKAIEVLKPLKSSIQKTDLYYPIPGEERIKNSNLTQNSGY